MQSKTQMAPQSPQPEARNPSGPDRGQGAASPAAKPRAVLAWVRSNRLKAGMAAAACLAAAGGLVALWWHLASPARHGMTMDMAMQALDAGAYAEARQIAETLRGGGLSPHEPLGAPAFVLGASAAYEAEDAWEKDKKQLHLLAARYLQEARDLGLPPDREAEGLYLLGRSLYLSGRMAACRPVLREALSADPRRKTEIRRLLAAAYLQDANPRLSDALQQNALYLADRSLPVEARYEGLLQRAEILLQLGRTSESTSTLNQIPSEAKNYVQAIVARGWTLIHEARALRAKGEGVEANELAAAEKYRAAIKTLRLAQARDTLAVQATRKAMYLIGVCYQELGDQRAAVDQFRRTRSKYPGTPEALAADFQFAELARRQGRDDEALAGYRRALGAVTDPNEYGNPWLPLDALRAGVLKAYEHYRDNEDFEICLQLTWLLYPAFPPARVEELTAETHRLWGRHLLARAHDRPPGKAEPQRRQGRAQLRRAGRAYERLARLRVVTKHYPDDLWEAAECYRDGKGYQKVIEILQEYLESQTQHRRPRALLHLGEALLAVGRIDEALSALSECIRFHPHDAASFRARVAASGACLEKGERERAQTLLEENLNGGVLTPKSDEWRDSLFALGQLLHVTGRYEKATARLEEAVARYADAPQAVEARYLIADSYHRRAKQLQEEPKEGLIESVRRAQREQASEFLQTALDQYQQIEEMLSRRRRTAELTPLEQSILRNCCFSVGSILLDQKQYEQAVKAYSVVTSRYSDAPEVLEAYVQMSRAYRRLKQPDEARRAIEQAKVVLSRFHTRDPASSRGPDGAPHADVLDSPVPARSRSASAGAAGEQAPDQPARKNADRFEPTTIYTDTQWSELLSWLDDT